MKHCPIISENGGPCPNSYLAVCPDLGNVGKCREVGIDEVIEPVMHLYPDISKSVITTSKKKKKAGEE